MLAVVERQAVALDAPRASAEHGRRLVQRARHAARASVTAAAQPAQPPPMIATRSPPRVFHAIHSLRSGVSDVRRSSTR